MSLSSIPRALRDEVFARDGGRCLYCRLRQYGQGAVFHINHIIPRSKGGATVAENLALQCPYCSLHKADRTSYVDPRDGVEAAIFHPLTQAWSEYFVLADDGSITGLGVIGRATVDALRMNDPIPRTATALQIRQGLL
jgi:hypothetical protein